MSIPPDFRDYEQDPVLSDERLTSDDADEPEAWGRAQTRRQQAQDLGHRAQNTDVEGFGGGKLTQAQMGVGIETTMTREQAMKTRQPPRILQYSDLFRQGTPLRMNRPQKPEKYGARTQAALLANIEKTRFMGNAPGSVSSYLERPTSKGTATQPDKARHGRLPDLRAVEPTTKEERLEQAAASPRHAHQDITEHETWRNLMEESPAHTAGTRESFDSLLSPRGGRAVRRAQRGGDPQILMTEDLSVHTPALTGWPGSVDPKTPDLPPPPSGRGGSRKQL